MKETIKPENIDEYIAAFPAAVQQLLQKIRTTIREAAPEAEEKISYQIPTFAFAGRNLVHFAAYAHHIGFYPASSGIENFQAELKPYKQGRGTVQFPLDKDIPYDLITKIVKFRVNENLERKKDKKKKG